MSDAAKAAPRSLYVRRDVVNKAEIVKWAKEQGFKTVQEELHVTITYSKTPVDWMKMGSTWGEKLEIPAGGARLLDAFGDNSDAIVLLFTSSELSWRHEEMKRNGASYDHFEYQPHITISWKAEGIDLEAIEPYRGKIVLGPEIFEEINEDWKATVVEKNAVRICKVDESLGIVFGWAIVCKIDGKDYYDLNVDKSGERVPEHIPEAAMLKATIDFMGGARAGNEMHAGPDVGTFVCAWPMTTEIAKAMGITTARTGLMVAYKPPADVLAKFKSGVYSGFSIEGVRLSLQEVEG